MSPVRRLLPGPARRFYVRYRASIGYVLLVVYVTVVGAVALHAISSEGRKRDEKLNGNRVAQTLKSCHERNVERRTLRRKIAKPLAATFRAQREQTRRVPREAFRQFQVTKREAIRRVNKAVRGLEKAKAAFHPLDCKARVEAVRDALD